jgi:histidinol-phosphatase
VFVENLSGKNMNVEQKLVDFAVSIAKEAGELTLSLFNGVDLEIIKKSDGSPVTQADRGAESLLRKRISDSFPEDSIIGEEEENVVGSSGRTWTLDPIDGTQSFINGVPLFANLVAFEDENGSAVGVINLPAIDECIWAGRGLGCFANGKKVHVSNTETLDGCCVVTSGVDYWNSLSFFESLSESETTVRTWGDAYGYALVATGRVDAMVDPIVNPWDVAPMLTIIPEAGGVFTDFKNVETANGGNALASNPALHALLINLVND